MASCTSDCCVSVASTARTIISARLAASQINLMSIESMLVSGGCVSCARRCASSRLPRLEVRSKIPSVVEIRGVKDWPGTRLHLHFPPARWGAPVCVSRFCYSRL